MDKIVTTALIIAGGTGQRMGQSVPKQFMEVFNKPVIIYTLEIFEKCDLIDSILVSCLDGWQDKLLEWKNKYNIKKLNYITKGGKNGQESIKNGLFELEKHCGKNSIVLIHDSIRPMVSEEIILNCIKTTKEKGCAIASIPCQEAMLGTLDGIVSNSIHPRDNLKRTQTPQGFVLKDIISAHKEADKKGINNSIASCTLMIEVGKKIFFSAGSEKNIKLTTKEDIEIFKALLKIKEGT